MAGRVCLADPCNLVRETAGFAALIIAEQALFAAENILTLSILGPDRPQDLTTKYDGFEWRRVFWKESREWAQLCKFHFTLELKKYKMDIGKNI